MVMLSHSRLEALNKAILRIYQPCSLAHLNKLLFTTVHKMVGFDMACTSLVHGDGKGADLVYNEPVGRILESFIPHLDDFFQMPGVADGRHFASRAPSSLHDFCSKNEWERSAIYQHLHRPMGVYHDITLHFHRYPNQTSCHLSLVRQKRAFNFEERLMLELLLPHLTLRYHQLLATEPNHPVYGSGRSFTENTWLLCSDGGRILNHSDDASMVLAQLGLKLRDRLPHKWRDWLKEQLSPPSYRSFPSPLVISNEYTRLTVYCVANHCAQEHRLILVPKLIGHTQLTARENEIAQWLATGKTNQEIGSILGISAHTVKTHVEHILKKLHVENRTAAVTLLMQEHQFNS